MTVVLERPAAALEDTPAAPPRRTGRTLTRLRPAHLPVLLGVLNAIAFLIVRPDVNDLWAARARASAAQDGVGLTYWFSWFGGGSTPGNYSVLTPWLSALIGTEMLAALSAAAIPALTARLLRGTRHPIAAGYVCVVAVGANLWSGRVPFLFAAAFGVAALLAFRAGRPVVALLAVGISIVASPTVGAFLAIGLAGVWLTRRRYRHHAGWLIGGVAAGFLAVWIIFGAPGPQPFSGHLRVELLIEVALLLLSRPPRWLRAALWLTVPAVLIISTVPNAMGSNLARLVWFCLPVAVVAVSRQRVWLALLLVALPLWSGVQRTYTDLRNSVKPISSHSYYTPLANRLDRLPDLMDVRVEVVSHGAHAAYDALLNHANLARGWETQDDKALNAEILGKDLDASTYRHWLNENAVGYVALPTAFIDYDGEYDLVSQRTPSYLTLIWRTPDWKLYRVDYPSTVVDPPAEILHASQASIVVDVPCACDIAVRVRFSKYLQATTSTGLAAEVANDGTGWTTLRTRMPGSYELRGALG